MNAFLLLCRCIIIIIIFIFWQFWASIDSLSCQEKPNWKHFNLFFCL